MTDDGEEVPHRVAHRIGDVGEIRVRFVEFSVAVAADLLEIANQVLAMLRNEQIILCQRVVDCVDAVANQWIARGLNLEALRFQYLDVGDAHRSTRGAFDAGHIWIYDHLAGGVLLRYHLAHSLGVAVLEPELVQDDEFFPLHDADDGCHGIDIEVHADVVLLRACDLGISRVALTIKAVIRLRCVQVHEFTVHIPPEQDGVVLAFKIVDVTRRKVGIISCFRLDQMFIGPFLNEELVCVVEAFRRGYNIQFGVFTAPQTANRFPVGHLAVFVAADVEFIEADVGQLCADHALRRLQLVNPDRAESALELQAGRFVIVFDPLFVQELLERLAEEFFRKRVGGIDDPAVGFSLLVFHKQVVQERFTQEDMGLPATEAAHQRFEWIFAGQELPLMWEVVATPQLQNQSRNSLSS